MSNETNQNSQEQAEVWMPQGICRAYPTETFFPSDGVGVDKAMSICRGCVVASFCLEYALENRIDHGVWGGESERGRKRILRQRSTEG